MAICRAMRPNGAKARAHWDTRRRALDHQPRRAKQTQLFIETPYRNRTMLEALIANCAPATLLSIAVDLTLATEQIVTRPLAQWRLDTLDLHKRPAIFSILAQ